MNKGKDTILADVRILLDEQRDNTALIEAEDQISVETDDIIWSYITQSVDEVHLAAQSYMVGPVATLTSISLTDYRKGKIGDMPTDFLRMIKVAASDLAVDVYDPINEDSDEYQMQSSKWAGVRGNSERPVVAIVPNKALTAPGLSMEIYGTTQSSAYLTYIKRCEVNASNQVDIAPMCYRSLLYTLAKHYLMTLGDVEKAGLFGLTAGGLIGVSQQPAVQQQQQIE